MGALGARWRGRHLGGVARPKSDGAGAAIKIVRDGALARARWRSWRAWDAFGVLGGSRRRAHRGSRLLSRDDVGPRDAARSCAGACSPAGRASTHCGAGGAGRGAWARRAARSGRASWRREAGEHRHRRRARDLDRSGHGRRVGCAAPRGHASLCVAGASCAARVGGAGGGSVRAGRGALGAPRWPGVRGERLGGGALLRLPGARPQAGWIAARAERFLGVQEEREAPRAAIRARVRRAYLAVRAHEIEAGFACPPAWPTWILAGGGHWLP